MKRLLFLLLLGASTLGCQPLPAPSPGPGKEYGIRDSVVVDWRASETSDESTFEVEVFRVEGEDESPIFSLRTPSNTSQASLGEYRRSGQLSPGGTYSYRVRHRKGTDEQSKWSPSSRFSVQPFLPPIIDPAPPFPAREKVILKWKPMVTDPDARYEVELGDHKDIESLSEDKPCDKALTRRQGVTSPELDVTVHRGQLLRYDLAVQDKDRAEYWFRVRQSIGNDLTKWSKPQPFRLAIYPAPELGNTVIEPTDKAFTVDWKDVEGAVGYRFELSSDANFDDEDHIYWAHVSSSEVDLRRLAKLKGNEGTRRWDFAKTFHVRVHALPAGFWKVSTVSFAAPPVVPTSDIELDVPQDEYRLTWGRVEKAERYTIEVYTDEQVRSGDWDGLPPHCLLERRVTKNDAGLDLDLTPYVDRDARNRKIGLGPEPGKRWLRLSERYHYRVLAHLPQLPDPFPGPLKRLRMDVRPPTPQFPTGEIDGNPLPSFRWDKPGEFEQNRYEVWINRELQDEKRPHKRFYAEDDASGLEWKDPQVQAALQRFAASRRNQTSATGGADEPDFFEIDTVYYWRIRTIHKGSGRVEVGSWSDWARFRVRRAAPKVQTAERLARSTTPRLDFEFDSWDRQSLLVKAVEIEIAPTSEGFSGRDLIRIKRDAIQQGLNSYFLQRRLAPNVVYNWRIRSVYEDDRFSEWRVAGQLRIPPNPPEKFAVGLISKTENIQEWMPAFDDSFTTLAYSTGYPRDERLVALADTIDPEFWQAPKEESPGYIFTKKMSHSARGMPLESAARGSFAESLRRGGFHVFREPTWTGDRRVFFSSNQYDSLSFARLSIMSRATDAPAQTAVVSAKSDESLLFPDVSSDGKTLCYTRARFDRDSMDELERAVRDLQRDPNLFGRYLAARSKAAQSVTYEIWTCDTNGAGKTFITKGAFGRFCPVGDELLFVNQASPDTPWNLWTCTTQGSKLSMIVQGPRGGRIAYPAWSNDGARIAYSANQASDDNDDIWIYDRKTGKQTQITQVLDDDRCPVWGKDDKYIVFVSFREGNYDLWYADITSLK
ncbi:MAG: hypothetical protein AB7N76_04955 [Planctomycetota bacterium]